MMTSFWYIFSTLFIIGCLNLNVASAECMSVSTWTNDCYYFCEDLGWDDGLHPGHEMAKYILENPEECDSTEIHWMKFENCSFPEGRLDADWFTHEPIPHIFKHLEFVKSNLRSIDDGAIFAYESFRDHLETFRLNGSPGFTILTSGILDGTTSPKFYDFEWSNNGIVEIIESEIFDQISTKLEHLHFSEVGFISNKILANITGKCIEHKAKKLIKLTVTDLLPQYGIPILSKKLFSAVRPNTFIQVDLSNASIEYFEDNTALDHFAKGLLDTSKIDLSDNKLKTIPIGAFDALMTNGVYVVINLKDNPWHCDCHIQHLQDIFNNATTKMVLDNAYQTSCVSPPSQVGISILAADLNTECEPLTDPPKINIQC